MAQLVYVNGRSVWFSNGDLVDVRTGCIKIERNGKKYEVFGGRTNGCADSEWYIDGTGDKLIRVASMVEGAEIVASL